jgi:hypothetical protein
MNNLYDVLEICLQELENGADLNVVLARYPDLANELRPILKASDMAKTMAVPAPSTDVIRRGRAKLLQRASEMREQKVVPRKRMIPLFQRLAVSFTLATVFLASGTGLVGASSAALPGENLYPVKRTWEDVRLFLTFDPNHKEFLESKFESERLSEVGDLLAEGRGDEAIQYSGVFMQANGVMYVSGVKVLIPANLQVPADGAAVVITGRTNAQRFVEIASIELLPAGAVVPVGEPVEVDDNANSNSGSGSEDGANSNSGSSSEDGAGSGSGNESQGNNTGTSHEADPQSFEMKGTVESISNNILIVNGQTVYLDNAKIEGVLTSGANVEIKGYYAADGRFIVTEIKVKDSGSSSDGSNNNSGSGSSSDSNSNDNSGSNSNDNSNSHDDSNSNDDNSGSGGGGENGNDSNSNG